MANSYSRSTYGSKLLSVLLSLVAVIILIFGLRYYHLSEKGIDLVCEGELYGEDASDDLKLTLFIETEGKNLSLNYQFFHNGYSLGKITFRGELDTIDVASMTYKFLIDGGKLQLGLDQEIIPPHIENLINTAKLALEYSKTENLDLQIINMNNNEGYAVIQFNPGNGIWICDLIDS